MSEFKDYFSSAPQDYRSYRPQYPAELFDFLADLCPAREHAWDCGCGNGQASVALAERFARVTATDASAAQVQEAEQRPNIVYAVSPAESMDTPAQSLDLITVAQAIHWFDHSRFFSAADRCLKPGGVLAAWGYQLLYTDTSLDEAVRYFHSELVGPYWPAGRELLEEGYSQINFPYPRESSPPFHMRQTWNYSQLLGYLNTWSAVKRYEQTEGRNPVKVFEEVLRRHWGENETRAVYWHLILYIGRKK